LRSTAPIGRPTVSDNHRRLRRSSRGSSLAPRPICCGSLGGGRGAIAAGWWSWHRSWISRDASRVQSMGNAPACGPQSLSRRRTEMAELYCLSKHLWLPFGPLIDVGERSGQLRPYVRPVARHLPLAIMGVRMRVRHQSVGRAQGTRLLPVLPELFLTTAFPSRGSAFPAGSAGLTPGAHRLAPERHAATSVAAATRPFAR
jgi:hypothetical protein